MHNEVENAADTCAAVAHVLSEEGWSFEIIPVDDGSTDRTGAELERIAAEHEYVKPVIYRTNRGRGYALRRGFELVGGEFVVSLDADLSYSPDHATRMVRMLIEDPELDIVLASPYMPGGEVQDVPFVRLAFSRVGNMVLRSALPQPVFTSTGIVRAYRAEALRALDLESDGKEIHLEILSEAMALGYRIAEMPSVLKTRLKGTSKFRPRSTVLSHLSFSLLERPARIFAQGGIVLMVVGAVIGAYLLVVYLGGTLNPERPLMTVMVLLFLGGFMAMSLAILAMQLLGMRRQLVRMQGEILRLRDDVRGDDRGRRRRREDRVSDE